MIHEEIGCNRRWDRTQQRLWGWNGWLETPLLIGGTIGSCLRMIIQSAGHQELTSLFWNHTKGKRRLSSPLLMLPRITGGIPLDGQYVNIDGQNAYLDGIQRALQNEQPWMSEGIESDSMSLQMNDQLESAIENPPGLSIVELHHGSIWVPRLLWIGFDRMAVVWSVLGHQ